MLIIITLLILIVITIFSVVAGSSFIGNVVENVIDNDIIINGTVTNLQLSSSSLFNIDPVMGFLATLTTIIVLVGIIGINFLGSGLSENAVRIITIASVYTGVWVVFSLLAEPLIKSIEIFGTLIYVVLTIGYIIGVVQKIAEG